MGLNNVDVSCIGIQVLRDPLPMLSHVGYGEMVAERDGEGKKRRGGRGVGALLYSQQHVPSQNGQFHRTFFVSKGPSQFVHFPLFLPFNCYLHSSSIDLAGTDLSLIHI